MAQRITQRFTALQFRAIGWYCDRHNLKLGLSAYPQVTLISKRDGSEHTEGIGTIVKQYQSRSTKEVA